MSYLFKSAKFLDVRKGELIDNVDVLVEGNKVKEVSDTPIQSRSAEIININGKILMPGLIDCHVHIFLSEVNLTYLSKIPLTLMTAKASRCLEETIMRGFTTVRDTGGADAGIRQSVADNLLVGPRLFVAGAPISQTGGHGEWRTTTQHDSSECMCCSALHYTSRVADGVPEVIKSVRDELRKGADFIKIMCSGGVASQTDPLESVQYRVDEIEAACEEAKRWGTYVAAHAYSSEAIKRGVKAGVRTIEHGNLMDESTAETMAKCKSFLMPTLVAYDSMSRRGKDFGMSEYSLNKNKKVLNGGLRSIELCRKKGVSIGFGTDLLGQLQNDQLNEFSIRKEVSTPLQMLQSATIVNASILQQSGRLGEIIPDAYADILVYNKNPLDDINILLDPEKNLDFIMKNGYVVKNNIT